MLSKLILKNAVCLATISFLKHDDFFIQFSNKLIFLCHLLSNHLKWFCFFSALLYLSSKCFLHVSFEIFYFILIGKYLLLKNEDLFIKVFELKIRRVFDGHWSDALFFKILSLGKIGWVDKILLNECQTFIIEAISIDWILLLTEFAFLITVKNVCLISCSSLHTQWFMHCYINRIEILN